MTILGVRTVVGPTILLSSGYYFDFLNPAGSVLLIDDIAHGLSLCCRFAGQCREFYSVAEHSVFVSSLVEPRHAYAALMHDAAEAFIGDVTRPLKSLLPQYKAIERAVEAAIFERFKVDMARSTSVVKEADLRALAAEQAMLMPSHDDQWPILAGIDVPRMPESRMGPEEAEAAFLARYEEVRPPPIGAVLR
ncbi:hypothetical protein BH11PSE5_BH11PSE5_30820 [soil metagenome]